MSRYGRPDEYDMVVLADPTLPSLENRVARVTREKASAFTAPFTILEIGTGSGMTTGQLVYEIRNPKIDFISVDPDSEAIKTAKKKVGYDKRIDYREADALTVLSQIASNSIPIVVTACTLHNLPLEERLQIFREIHRVLMPGGYFINGDKIAVDDMHEHAHALAEEIQRLPLLGATSGKLWTTHYLEDEAIRMAETEYYTVMAQIGFNEIEPDSRFSLNRIMIAKK